MSTEIISETVGFRLSPQQERLLAVDSQGAAQCAIALGEPVDEAQMRQALETVLARHEILRTTFPSALGVRGRTQVIRDTPELEWHVEARQADAPAAGEGPRALAGLLERARANDFDLEQGPRVRALLVSPAQPSALLVLTVHAACADAQSLALIAAELLVAYAGGPEPEEPVQYADYAEWRHEQLTAEEAPDAGGRAFWRAQIEQAPAAPRVQFASGGPGSGRTRAISVPLTAEQVERLRAAAAASAVTVASLVEACWHATLARVTGAGELMLASWCDGRTHPDVAGAVGPYAQAVPVLSRFGEQTTFAEVIDQVNRGRAEVAAQADLATGEDLAAIGRASVAAFHAAELPALAAPASAVEVLMSPGGALGLACLAGSGELRVQLWHDPAVVAEADAEVLARALATLASTVSADTAVPVAQLPLLDAEEQQALLAASAGPPPSALADVPVHHRFEQLAQAHRSAPAVASAGRQITYGELNAQANRLAHLLRDAGAQTGSRVGLCLDRGCALLEGLLGILKAGSAYVPLNHEHPPARLAHQLKESGAVALITEEAMLDRLPAFEGEIICLDRDRGRILEFSAADPEPVAEPCGVAYVMYTSGSTGAPKGVAITHRNLANYAADMAGRVTGTADPAGGLGLRFGVVSAITTDLGNTCIFPALVSGGCVQLISTTAAMDAKLLVHELAGERVDVLKITPSHLRALLDGDEAVELLPQRVLVFGGEPLSWELVGHVRELAPELTIINHYGPTETTIGCCAYEVGAPRSDCATVPVGRPLAGVRAYVLDHSGAPAPPGVPGEICIAGAGVSRGYVGQQDEGAFVPAVSGSGPMYRTGDRARRLPDGAIEFLGRIDDQVKVRGFRVEPGEIETVLSRHSAIRQAAVVAESDEQGQTRLVAYLACAAHPSVEELQVFLAESLPTYMIPSAFVMLDSLPFTASGKIDRRALPAMGSVAARPGGEYVAPRDPVEKEIAAIWRGVLGVERIGVHDDFFALGGHSLLAAQAIMRIRKQYGDIPLRALLASPTVAALAGAVRAANHLAHHEEASPHDGRRE